VDVYLPIAYRVAHAVQHMIYLQNTVMPRYLGRFIIMFLTKVSAGYFNKMKSNSPFSHI
jgi:hypothetical protein